MSDADFGDEYAEEVTRQAKLANVGSLDDDPEQASRSLELSRATGVPATAIYGDVDGFERQNKAALGSAIIGDNLHIADYLNSDPMAARVSGDDLGQLDTVSSAINRLHPQSFLQRVHQALGVGRLSDVAFPDDPLEAFKSAYATRPTDEEWALKHPAAYSIMKGLNDLIGTPIVAGSTLLTGATNLIKEFGGRDLAAMLEYEVMKPETSGLAKYLEDTPKLGNALQITARYAKAGKEPGIGVHPFIDEIKAEQAKQDGDAIKESLRESLKSATRDRSPEMYASFVRSHVGDREIGIDAEAVRKLYGDKIPTADDNLLGWVPDLQSKLAAAEGVGGDISVPLADWLSKVDPEVAKTLHDDLRVRDGGLTLNEAKDLGDGKTAIADPVQLIRGEGGFEPQFSVGDRKLQILKTGEVTEEPGAAWEGPAKGTHQFDINDETGKKVGNLDLRPLEDGKSLFIDWIGGLGGVGPQDLGPSLMRDVWKQLREQYPDAERVGGYRVTGARDKAGKLGVAWVKFDEAPEGWSHVEPMREIMSGAWEPRGGGRVEILKPHQQSLDYQHLTDVINRELQRLVPRKLGGVETGAGLRRTTEGAPPVRGMYQRFVNQLPQILVSLDEPDLALGVAQHEAIHHLRRYGFFNEGEWSTLTQTAKDEKWQERYLGGRYKDLGEADRLEESVAEAFRLWKAGQTMPEGVHAIFEKLKQFIESIKTSFKELAGKDLNWEEIFRKVDTGEIGGREGTVPLEEGGRKPFDIQASEREDSLSKFTKVGDTPTPANENLTLKERLPEALSRSDRDWQNYGKNLKPEEVLDSEVVWARAAMYQDAGLGRAEGFADAANDLWQRMGANRHITPELARRYMSVQEAKAKGISGVDFEPQASEAEGGELEGLFEKAKAMGVTQAHMNRMLDLIKKRNSEDLAKAQGRAEKEQKRSQTREWKERRTTIRDEVQDQLKSRPDLATDELFSKQKIKIDPAYLNDTQKALLPKDYIQKKDGINPDELAPYFGYASGDALVERLGMLTQDRQRAGMSAKDYFNRLVDIETDRRLNAEFGDLNQRIMEEAKDQALSETQLNLVHEETMAYALAAKQEPKFTQQEVRDQVRQAFDQVPVGQVSSDRLIQTAGKIGRKIEEAASKGDWAEAYRLSQQRNHATIAAKYARDYEKQRAQLDRTAKQFKKREVPSVPAEYTNWIHDLLIRGGYAVNRSVQDLAENIGRQSSTTLQAFMDQKTAEWMGLRDLPIADMFADPTFRKPIDELTHADFRDYKNAIDVLAKAGRDEQKIYREGESADRAQVLGEMIGKLETFPLKPGGNKGFISRKLEIPKAFIAGMTNIETLLNRWDRADPRGIFNRYIAYPLARASNTKNVLEREAARNLKEVGVLADRDKLVDAPFVDPATRTSTNPDGTGWPGFNRSNVMAMIHNAGNKSNWTVLAKGYGQDPAALMQWLFRNSDKEMWDRAQKMGDLFKGLAEKADNVYERLTGASVEKIKLEPIQTPWGTYEGWYHPLIRDANPARQELWSQDQSGQWTRKPTGRKVSVYDELDNHHISTANGYTKRRTGAIYALDLSTDAIPARLKQIIHDVAFRETILETDKIFGNAAFRAEVVKHYGEHYEDLLQPYLKHLAGQESIASQAQSKAAQLSEYLRQNVISTYIGFNPFTALKHGPTAWVMSMGEVGPKNFLNAVRSLYGQSPELGLSNSAFAMKWSEELQRRERHWQDTVAGEHSQLEGRTNLRDRVIEKGSWLVAQSDMLSAKPTWIAAYNKYLGDGLSHGESIDLADRAVRRAHGSTAASNQPALVQARGALHGWLTSVYGFFGTAMQRRIEIAHQLNDTYHLVGEGEIGKAARTVPGIAADVFTYVIWPTIVEEWVTGLTTDDRRGWGTKLASAATMGLASSVLYLRDMVHAFVTGQDPSVGLISSPLHDVNNMLRDFKKGRESMNKVHAGKTIADTLTVLGHATGMAPKTLDNAIRFGIDTVNHQTHPRGPADVARGLLKGTTKERVEK